MSPSRLHIEDFRRGHEGLDEELLKKDAQAAP